METRAQIALRNWITAHVDLHKKLPKVAEENNGWIKLDGFMYGGKSYRAPAVERMTELLKARKSIHDARFTEPESTSQSSGA